jgi:hypothetical protein
MNEITKKDRRIMQKENHVNSEKRIAKLLGIPQEQPHRNSKTHVANCGRKHCYLCCNPRKLGYETIQERAWAELENSGYWYE